MPSTVPSGALPAPQRLPQLRTMLRIRRFEEALIDLAQAHDVGHFHVYIGQEATGVPALALLEDGDVAYSTHRNHGHLLARGVDPNAMLAEILGRATGTNGGKGGTLHLASPAHGFPTTSASVGGPLPIAVGSAFAFRELGRDRVSVALFGDGALEEGAWHEAANIAALRQLPVVFLCENNSVGAVTQQAGDYPSSTLAVGTLADLARPFGIPAAVIDGSDSDAVHAAMSDALVRARSGDGPSFIEARTVRWPGNQGIWAELVTGRVQVHYGWDAATIPDPHRAWFAEHDPVVRAVREALAAGAGRDAIAAIDADATREMAAAVAFALASPWPDADEAFANLYADPRVNALATGRRAAK